VTLRYQSRLRDIGVGRAYAGQKVLLLAAERDVGVLSEDGELLGHCVTDPAKGYQSATRTTFPSRERPATSWPTATEGPPPTRS
jgi:hypothetical protein